MRKLLTESVFRNRPAGAESTGCVRRGLIAGQATLVDRRRAGFKTQIFALIRLTAKGREDLEAFSTAIKAFDEVLECHVTLGPTDFILRIVAEDIEAYERFFFQRLSRVPGVQEINSMVTLSEIKSTTALSLLSRI